jgi:hypothetical protein
MTVANENSKPKDHMAKFNRWLYAAFVLLSVYFLTTRQLESAMTNLGIALIFDPFDQKVTWSNRPMYQRLWLMVHATIVMTLISYFLATKFG